MATRRMTPEGEPAISELGVLMETREFMGVCPLQVFIASEPLNALQAHLIKGILDTAPRTGVAIHEDPKHANTIFFPANLNEETRGMFDYPAEFRRGVSGVAIASIQETPNGVNLVDFAWQMLGNAATQYGILVIGDPISNVINGAYVFSMEGAHPHVDFRNKGKEEGFLELTRRLTHLAGGEKASHWGVERTMPEDQWREATVPGEIIETGKRLRAMGLLPDIRLEDYVSPKRAREIRLFLEVSGLSIGNMSGWDEKLRLMWITGSGWDKGNLKRDQVVAISQFNDNLNGTTVWAPEGAKRVKPSVETFDHLLAYYASALVASGYLTQPDLEELLSLIRNQELVLEVLSKTSPSIKSMIHIHLWPQEWNPNLFQIVEVNSQLVPQGAYHSSCGTRPLALYGTEALIRGVLEGDGRIVVAKWPNHGIQVASPLSLQRTTNMIDPKAGNIRFTEVPSV